MDLDDTPLKVNGPTVYLTLYLAGVGDGEVGP